MPTTLSRSATLIRQPSTSDGTFGQWISDSGFTCVIVEKPWMDNETDVSCIPEGRYLVEWDWSPGHKCNLYHVRNVPNRSGVEIHSANIQTQLLGCIAPGAIIAPFKADSIRPGVPEVDTRGVTMSMDTLAKLEKDMQNSDGNQVSFYLTIS